MNTRTTIVMLVLAIVLAGGAWYITSRPDAAEQTAAAEPASKDLFDPNPTEIVKLTVEEPGKPPRTLERRDGQWRITAPFEAAADEYAAGDDARLIAGLQVDRKYEPGAADAPGDALTGLAQPHMTVTFTDADGATHTLYLGNLTPMGGATYVRKDDDPAIYVVQQNLLDSFSRPLAQYRQKRVTGFATANAVKLQVAGKQEYELVKVNGQWVIEQPIRGRADTQKVDQILQAASGLWADSFMADQPADLGIFGLAPPRLELTVVTETRKTTPPATQPAEDGATTQPAETVETQTTTLLVGHKAGDKYFAKVADSPSVFYIPETTVKSLDLPLNEVRARALAAIDAAKVTRFEVQAAGRTATLEKGSAGWHATGDVEGLADSTAVSDFLTRLAGAEAAAFEGEGRLELVSYGFDQPRGRIRLEQQGRVEPVELLIGQDTPSGEMTFLKNVGEDTVAVVKRSDAQDLLVDPLSLLDRSITQFDRDDASRITMQRDGRTFALAHDDGQWRMTEPVEAAADREVVSNILADLSNLRARQVVAIGDAAQYGLDEPQVAVTVYTKPEPAASAATQPDDQVAAEAPATQPAIEIAHSVLLSQANGKTYAMRPDQPWIYEVDSVVFTHLASEVHDRTVVTFDPAEVAAIQLPGEDGQPLEFTRKGDDWIYLADPFFPVDPARVTEWLGLLRGLRVERYAAYQADDMSGFGLDEPLYQVRVTLESGQVLNLKIAQPTETGKYVASLDGRKSAFELPAASVRQLQRSLTYFKKT